MALTDNIVAYYKFDNDYEDAAGSLDLTNSGAEFTTAKLGAAAILLGETDVLTSTSSSFDIATLSAACWVNTTDTTNSKTIIMGSNGGGNAYQWRIGTDLKPHLNKQGVTTIATATTALTSGWHHIAVTYNNVTGVCIFYLDGSADGGGTSAQTFTYGNFSVGMNSTSEGFIGNIDELGVWSRVLTSTEITALYNGGTGIQYPFSTAYTVTTTNTIMTSNTLTLVRAMLQTITNTITTSVSVLKTWIANLTTTDSFGVSTSELKQINWLKEVIEQAGITDLVAFTRYFDIDVIENLTETDLAILQLIYGKPVSENITVTDLTAVWEGFNVNLSDTITLSDYVTRGVALGQIVTSYMTLSNLVSFGQRWNPITKHTNTWIPLTKH